MTNDDYELFDDKYHNPAQYEKDQLEAIYENNTRPIFRTYSFHVNKSIPFVNKDFRDSSRTFINTKSLARITDPIYFEIEKFPDHDYSNSIAFEMLIRTKEYNLLYHDTNIPPNEKIKLYDKLGIDYNELNSFHVKKISKPTSQKLFSYL